MGRLGPLNPAAVGDQSHVGAWPLFHWRSKLALDRAEMNLGKVAATAYCSNVVRFGGRSGQRDSWSTMSMERDSGGMLALKGYRLLPLLAQLVCLCGCLGHGSFLFHAPGDGSESVTVSYPVIINHGTLQVVLHQPAESIFWLRGRARCFSTFLMWCG